jgi:hypothetical protein
MPVSQAAPLFFVFAEVLHYPLKLLQGSAVLNRDGAGFAEHAAVLVVHLEEEQVGELLDVVAVGHAVVAQDVAVVPEALDDGGGGGCGYFFSTNFTPGISLKCSSWVQSVASWV